MLNVELLEYQTDTTFILLLCLDLIEPILYISAPVESIKVRLAYCVGTDVDFYPIQSGTFKMYEGKRLYWRTPEECWEGARQR